MRYPIFVFEEYGDLMVFETPDQHWNNLEAYDIANPHTLFDRDGHVLTMTDAGNDRVKILESSAESDPERLRQMLIRALGRVGQQWGRDATLDSLCAAAQATYGSGKRGVGITEPISRLLRFLRLRRPSS